jgi:hypothetical protein
MDAVVRSGRISRLLSAARNPTRHRPPAALASQVLRSSAVSASAEGIEADPVNTHRDAGVSTYMLDVRRAAVLGLLATVLHAATARSITTPDTITAPIPRGCPYSFLSDMPPGRFCAYRGAAMGRGGAVCSREAVVIWSAHGPLMGSGGSGLTTSERSVYFGFVDAPSLLVRAVVERSTRARLVEYRTTPDDEATELGGLTTLQRSLVGPPMLRMSTTTALPFGANEDACDMESYRGIFVGVIDMPCDACARD